ncbi:MotA/TolQ/ExbB proton channel family protein [Methylotenera sp. G11]|uniref:MotA/TolQ/ExbB proton channel family protein n=1 Tax=Methylotenera sp. G11 TaxID=1506585 RepID=UPI0006461D7E|nr:MotA/TolQ/ExbB proton channel family protein [Methylotenera sp. G11]
MQNGYEFNAWEFIAAGGVVSFLVAATLLIMSVASWYLIITKSIAAWRLRAAYKSYKQQFWNAPNLNAALKIDQETALSVLAKEAVAAAEHHKLHASRNSEQVTQDEFVARAMNRSIAEESAKMESGLTVLASVGSVSPFVGLFGTVWGIYHALASISASGQATLDKVAGPVGEALIMTALGLAVAIPAVLAYNALVRSNRALSGELEKFGYSLHTLLTTGAVIKSAHDEAKLASAKEHIHIAEVPA